MKVIFFGTPSFAVPTLQLLLDDPKIEVMAVVTQPDKRRGRGSQLIPSPVKEIATKNNLPVYQPEKIKKDRESIEQLKAYQADYFIVVAYGQILSQEILNIPHVGCINVHGSLLPEYRGAAPIQWGIYNGDRTTGITTMLMDIGMDTGAMLLKKELPIHLLDNSHTIAEKLSQMGAELLRETLYKYSEITPIPQNNQQATYASLIQKKDYELNWEKTALQLHNQIRAFHPHCHSLLNNQELKIIASIPLVEEYLLELDENYKLLREWLKQHSPPEGIIGSIEAMIKNWGFVVQTGLGLLLIREVQPVGKRPQSAWDFVNGHHLTIGQKFATIELKGGKH